MKILTSLCIFIALSGCVSKQDPPKNVMYPEVDAKEKCPPEGNASRIK